MIHAPITATPDSATLGATLEQQLANLAARHDLSHLAIHLHRRDDGTTYFGAVAQGGGHCAFNRYEHDNATPASVHVATAIERLNALRTAAVEVAPLPAMQAAVQADPTTWAYKEGARALHAGEGRDSNPCNLGSESERAAQWIAGYDAAEEGPGLDPRTPAFGVGA